MKKPQFSQKLLDTINRVHTSASQIYGSFNPKVIELISLKIAENTSANKPVKKMKK